MSNPLIITIEKTKSKKNRFFIVAVILTFLFAFSYALLTQPKQLRNRPNKQEATGSTISNTYTNEDGSKAYGLVSLTCGSSQKDLERTLPVDTELTTEDGHAYLLLVDVTLSCPDSSNERGSVVAAEVGFDYNLDQDFPLTIAGERVFPVCQDHGANRCLTILSQDLAGDFYSFTGRIRDEDGIIGRVVSGAGS